LFCGKLRCADTVARGRHIVAWRLALSFRRGPHRAILEFAAISFSDLHRLFGIACGAARDAPAEMGASPRPNRYAWLVRNLCLAVCSCASGVGEALYGCHLGSVSGPGSGGGVQCDAPLPPSES